MSIHTLGQFVLHILCLIYQFQIYLKEVDAAMWETSGGLVQQVNKASDVWAVDNKKASSAGVISHEAHLRCLSPGYTVFNHQNANQSHVSHVRDGGSIVQSQELIFVQHPPTHENATFTKRASHVPVKSAVATSCWKAAKHSTRSTAQRLPWTQTES